MVGRDETWRYLVVVVGGDSITHLMVHQGLWYHAMVHVNGRWRAVGGLVAQWMAEKK